MPTVKSNSALSALTTPKPARRPAAQAKIKTFGTVHVQVGGVRVFSRSIWEESTSENQLINEINDMARDAPEELEALFKEKLFGADSKCTVEVVHNSVAPDQSLESLLNSFNA